MRGVFLAALLPGALAGSCANSATLEYPAGAGPTATSTVAPYEELGGSAGFTFAAWVYRESTTPHTDTPVIFNFQSSASPKTPGQISLTFKSSMFYITSTDSIKASDYYALDASDAPNPS